MIRSVTTITPYLFEEISERLARHNSHLFLSMADPMVDQITRLKLKLLEKVSVSNGVLSVQYMELRLAENRTFSFFRDWKMKETTEKAELNLPCQQVRLQFMYVYPTYLLPVYDSCYSFSAREL